jgi:hypothetical protein
MYHILMVAHYTTFAALHHFCTCAYCAHLRYQQVAAPGQAPVAIVTLVAIATKRPPFIKGRCPALAAQVNTTP